MDSGIFGYRVRVIPPKLRGQNDNIFTRCFFTLLIPEIKKNPTSFHSIFCPTPYYSALHLFFFISLCHNTPSSSYWVWQRNWGEKKLCPAVTCIYSKSMVCVMFSRVVRCAPLLCCTAFHSLLVHCGFSFSTMTNYIIISFEGNKCLTALLPFGLKAELITTRTKWQKCDFLAFSSNSSSTLFFFYTDSAVRVKDF